MTSTTWVWFSWLMVFAGSSEAANCYSVYSSSNELIFQSRTSPIDLRNASIGPEVAAKFPGGTLIFGDRGDVCSEITPKALARASAQAVQTEEANRLRNTRATADAEQAGARATREGAKNEAGRKNDERLAVAGPDRQPSAQLCQIHVGTGTALVLGAQKIFKGDPVALKEAQEKARIEDAKYDGLRRKVADATTNLMDKGLTKEQIHAHLVGVCMSGSN
ncbi:MAG: hypothetical protein ACOYNZ_13705 [Rhodoferax sp.]